MIEIADLLENCSGADIENMINIVALKAVLSARTDGQPNPTVTSDALIARVQKVGCMARS